MIQQTIVGDVAYYLPLLAGSLIGAFLAFHTVRLSIWFVLHEFGTVKFFAVMLLAVSFGIVGFVIGIVGLQEVLDSRPDGGGCDELREFMSSYPGGGWSFAAIGFGLLFFCISRFSRWLCK